MGKNGMFWLAAAGCIAASIALPAAAANVKVTPLGGQGASSAAWTGL